MVVVVLNKVVGWVCLLDELHKLLPNLKKILLVLKTEDTYNIIELTKGSLPQHKKHTPSHNSLM